MVRDEFEAVPKKFNRSGIKYMRSRINSNRNGDKKEGRFREDSGTGEITPDHGETQPFTPFDRFAFFRESKGKTLLELLETFERLRKENLEVLENLRLKPRQFDLKGTHPEFGTVTLSQLLVTWVVHDLDHIYQVVRVMSHQYHDAAGPWKNYLSIL